MPGRIPIGDGNKYLFNPLVVDDLMYVLGKGNSIVALNAATGAVVWTHSPGAGTRVIVTRGINYWESKDRSDRRVLFAANQLLRAIDARTGKPIATFGNNGMVDLREGLGRDPKSLTVLQSMSPGRVFEDLLILGTATNQGYGSAPGDIRAFDVRTGKVVWTFHTIPHPGEFGYDTWPKDAWQKVGGANVWSEMSVDTERGILYAPTASAKYNFYGADRLGANLFADCLLALNARTGERLWHFQMVHHDIWDYDDPTAPKLLTVRHEGKNVAAVAQVSKQGWVWVFDRVTGKPLWPIEERPVPATDMPQDKASATQPFPTKPPPFARQKFTVDDLSPYLTPEDRARFRDQILSARNEGLFTPPAKRGTIQMPGNNGGGNWGGTAVDPAQGMLLVVSKDLPSLLKLEEKAPKPAETAEERYESGFGFMIASDGLERHRAAVDVDDHVRPERGDDQMEGPAGRGSGAGGEGDSQYGDALSQSGPGIDGGRVDLHRHARSQGAGLRRVECEAAVGEGTGYGDGRNARGVRNRREAIHRLLRGGAGGFDSGDSGAD